MRIKFNKYPNKYLSKQCIGHESEFFSSMTLIKEILIHNSLRFL